MLRFRQNLFPRFSWENPFLIEESITKFCQSVFATPCVCIYKFMSEFGSFIVKSIQQKKKR